MAHAGGVEVARHIWQGTRVENKRQSVVAALAMVRKLLENAG
jgi:hypothetical protein